MQAVDIRRAVNIALAEDIGSGDVTTNILVSADHKSSAMILVKDTAVICGVAFVKEVFRQVDPRLKVSFYRKDGECVRPGDVLVRLHGKTRSILTGERVALNFFSYLSAIATRTASFCNAVRPYPVSIMDTRKTTPGQRLMERYAVDCGGGVNHRFGLDDMVLVKDNHRAIIAQETSLAQAVLNIRRKTKKKIEVEVDSLEELKDVLNAAPDMILLDNMPLSQVKKAVCLVREYFKGKVRPLIEVSGGVSLANVRRIAATGVDRISIGALTHSRQAIDMSLEVVNG